MRKILMLLLLYPWLMIAQSDQTGAWYIYFGSLKKQGSSFSFDPEVQYRNHNYVGDMQQFLARGILRYTANPNFSAGVGYAYISTENIQQPDNPVPENRIHQEIILSQKLSRFNFRHRFRYEQRFVQGRDFNTRYRYNLFLDIPLNHREISKGTVYMALYNEIFINGKKTKDTPNVFDRDRIYLGAGYRFNTNLAVQLGWMNQVLENSAKSQILLSIHHQFTIHRSSFEIPTPVRDLQ